MLFFAPPSYSYLIVFHVPSVINVVDISSVKCKLGTFFGLFLSIQFSRSLRWISESKLIQNNGNSFNKP